MGHSFFTWGGGGTLGNSDEVVPPMTSNIGEIHYHKGEQNKCSEQIEFGAERNQFEKKAEVGINEMYSNC